MVGDPTEGALIVAAAKAGALPNPLNKAYPRVQEIPLIPNVSAWSQCTAVDDPQPDDISPFYDDDPEQLVCRHRERCARISY